MAQLGGRISLVGAFAAGLGEIAAANDGLTGHGDSRRDSHDVHVQAADHDDLRHIS